MPIFSKEKSKLVAPTLSESDKLNGNNELLEAEKAGQEATGASAAPARQADGGSERVVLRKKPVCAAAKQPAARASMANIPASPRHPRGLRGAAYCAAQWSRHC